jgi:hypothetical protein
MFGIDIDSLIMTFIIIGNVFVIAYITKVSTNTEQNNSIKDIIRKTPEVK